MFFRKHFAKAALKSDKAISKKTTSEILSLGIILIPLSISFGVATGVAIESDSGNEYQEQIYQQYDKNLMTLEQAKKSYDEKYNLPPSTKEKQTANITNSINDITDSLFNFLGGDDDVTAKKYSAEKDWEQIMFFSDVFAKAMITDKKLSEADADKLIERLENNVISFKDLGYGTTPDAYDLRECQAVFPNNANRISSCTVQTERASSDEVLTGAGLGLLFGMMLLPGVPLATRRGVKTHRETLQKWAKGKKGNTPKH